MRGMQAMAAVALMLCRAPLSPAAEFLENGDFSNPDLVLNNCQISWQIDIRTSAEDRGSAKCLFGDGCATLKVTAAASRAFLVQRDLPLPSGRRYQVSYEVRSPDSSRYAIYVEWRRQDKSFHSVSAGKALACPPGWERRAFEFTLEEPHVRPYLAITLCGMGSASFRNLSIQDVDANEQQR